MYVQSSSTLCLAALLRLAAAYGPGGWGGGGFGGHGGAPAYGGGAWGPGAGGAGGWGPQGGGGWGGASSWVAPTKTVTAVQTVGPPSCPAPMTAVQLAGGTWGCQGPPGTVTSTLYAAPPAPPATATVTVPGPGAPAPPPATTTVYPAPAPAPPPPPASPPAPPAAPPASPAPPAPPAPGSPPPACAGTPVYGTPNGGMPSGCVLSTSTGYSSGSLTTWTMQVPTTKPPPTPAPAPSRGPQVQTTNAAGQVQLDGFGSVVVGILGFVGMLL